MSMMDGLRPTYHNVEETFGARVCIAWDIENIMLPRAPEDLNLMLSAVKKAFSLDGERTIDEILVVYKHKTRAIDEALLVFEKDPSVHCMQVHSQKRDFVADDLVHGVISNFLGRVPDFHCSGVLVLISSDAGFDRDLHAALAKRCQVEVLYLHGSRSPRSVGISNWDCEWVTFLESWGVRPSGLVGFPRRDRPWQRTAPRIGMPAFLPLKQRPAPDWLTAAIPADFIEKLNSLQLSLGAGTEAAGTGAVAAPRNAQNFVGHQRRLLRAKRRGARAAAKRAPPSSGAACSAATQPAVEQGLVPRAPTATSTAAGAQAACGKAAQALACRTPTQRPKFPPVVPDTLESGELPATPAFPGTLLVAKDHTAGGCRPPPMTSLCEVIDLVTPEPATIGDGTARGAAHPTAGLPLRAADRPQQRSNARGGVWDDALAASVVADACAPQAKDVKPRVAAPATPPVARAGVRTPLAKILPSSQLPAPLCGACPKREPTGGSSARPSGAENTPPPAAPPSPWKPLHGNVDRPRREDLPPPPPLTPLHGKLVQLQREDLPPPPPPPLPPPPPSTPLHGNVDRLRREDLPPLPPSPPEPPRKALQDAPGRNRPQLLPSISPCVNSTTFNLFSSSPCFQAALARWVIHPRVPLVASNGAVRGAEPRRPVETLPFPPKETSSFAPGPFPSQGEITAAWAAEAEKVAACLARMYGAPSAADEDLPVGATGRKRARRTAATASDELCLH